MDKQLTEIEKANGCKLFKARPGQEARLTHPAGHVQVIGQEWVAVHPMFHADAYANGCVSDDMAALFAGSNTGSGSGSGFDSLSLSPEQRKEKIMAAIAQVANSGDASLCTGYGKPKTDVLSQYAGFTVTAAERDAIIKELVAEED